MTPGRLARRVATAAAVFVALLSPAVAYADSPGPSDYRTVVTSIEPAVSGVRVAIVGGDSFVELRVDAGVSVEVPGYSGGPYLRFAADGTVEENRASPTYYANASRYGGAVPAGAADAAPRWVKVADNGRFAWHDHRTHWMSAARPPGKHPGDVILDAELPLTVDGLAVLVHVQSTWLLPPSRLPPLGGLAGGIVLAAIAIRLRVPLAVVGAVALLALAVGLVGYRSVPAETGPPFTLWLLPLLSATVAAGAMAARGRLSDWNRQAATVLAATPLVVWGWTRQAAMWRALIPTDAPMWLDRAVVGSSFTLAACCGLWMLVAAFDFGARDPQLRR